MRIEHESTRISFHPGPEVHNTAMSRDACAAYVDSLGPDWCSLLASEQPQVNVSCRIRPSAGRPSTLGLAAADGGATGSRWRATVLRSAKRCASCRWGCRGQRGCATLPKGGPRLCCCIATRGSACAEKPTLFPHSRAEDLCHKPLGSRPPSGGGDGHELGELAFVVGIIWGGNPGPRS